MSTTSTNDTVTLTHTGVAGSPDINVTDVTITGADATDFSDDFAVPVALAPGETLDIEVTFTPATNGVKAAALEVDHDGGNGPTTSVSLAGEGIDPNAPPTLAPIADLTGIDAVSEGDVVSIPINGGDVDSGDTLTLSITGLPPEVLTDDDDGTGSIDWTTDFDDSGTYPVTVAITDGINPPVEQSFTIDVLQTDAGTVLYRVNAGDTLESDAAGDWAPDTNGSPSPYRTDGTAFSGNITFPVGLGDATVPSGTPARLFEKERYGDQTWSFPVSVGAEIEVRVYLAEVFNPVVAVGDRVFDVEIEGVIPADGDNVDLFVDPGKGEAYVVDRVFTATDGLATVNLFTVEDNAKISAIEVREITPGPNVAPVIGVDDASPSLLEGESGSVNVSATDGNPFDTLTFSLDGTEPGFASIDPVTGVLSLTPTSGDESGSPYVFNAEVSDGLESDAVTINVEVTVPVVPADLIVDKWMIQNWYRINSGGPWCLRRISGPTGKPTTRHRTRTRRSRVAVSRVSSRSPGATRAFPPTYPRRSTRPRGTTPTTVHRVRSTTGPTDSRWFRTRHRS